MFERSPVRVVFLAGAARSGGTLLEYVLARRFGLFPVGELVYVWERGYTENQLCSCGRAFLDCEFWRNVTEDAFGGVSEVDVGRIREAQRRVVRTRSVPRLLGRGAGSRFRADLREYRAALGRLYTSIARVSGADTLVDSSRTGAYGLVLSRVDTIDLRVLHLIRDSRAYAYSRTRVRTRPEIHWKDAEMLRTSVAVSSREWVRLNALAEILGRRSSHFSRLRYEDFALDTEAALEKLAPESGIGLPARGTANPWLEDVGYHTVSGNPLRFDLGRLQIHLDDEWLAGMTLRSKLVVGSLTLPLLARYGYLVKSPYRQSQLIERAL